LGEQGRERYLHFASARLVVAHGEAAFLILDGVRDPIETDSQAFGS
jgi:hypothetical protein